MDKTLTILFLGGAKRVSMARELIRAGKDAGYKVDIYSHELTPQVPIASVAKVIVGGKYSIPATALELNQIISSYQVDIVIPFVDPAISLISDIRKKHPTVYAPTPEAEVVEKLFDKVASASLFEENDIPVPATYTVNNIAFPAICKPRKGSASKGIVVVENEEDLKSVQTPENYLIQEYITDCEEYTLDCFIGTRDGEIKCVVPRLRIETAGGEVTRTITCRIPQLIALGSQTIEKLGLRGAVTLQFIYDRKNERFLLMEINPRPGGGVICSIKSGADIAGMIIADALNQEIKPQNLWRDGALMTRYMQEVIFFNDSGIPQ